jgi:hypothetical protein
MKVLTFKCHFSSGVFFTCGNFGQQLFNFDFLFEFCEKGGKVSKVILISSHLREIKKKSSAQLIRNKPAQFYKITFEILFPFEKS